ncbi:HU family DNA-binding protein [Photobacterium leiognathi]|uniref:HU family DNA-binding protein n=1 Tax=Photobacterium leiognathi TaxID=553611 RepID=UPI002980F670|nr:HU family DNA-binding protein [Photobacterium leiognathi]
MTVNVNTFVKQVAQKTELPAKQVSMLVEVLNSTFAKWLANGDEIMFRQLGTFRLALSKPYGFGKNAETRVRIIYKPSKKLVKPLVK